MKLSEIIFDMALVSAGFCIGGICAVTIYDKMKQKSSFEGYQKRLFDSCMKENQEQGVKLDGYFLRNGYKRIVVYGMGAYQEAFLDDISRDNFDAVVLADKGAKTLYKKNEKIYSLEEVARQDFYDVIVVTSYNHAKEIEKELRDLGVQKEIISYRTLVMNATKEQ